jgi:bacterioferritin
MKGDLKVLETLNALLARELTVVSQNTIYAEMYNNRGYNKLHNIIQKRTVNEMKHAESFIERKNRGVYEYQSKC